MLAELAALPQTVDALAAAKPAIQAGHHADLDGRLSRIIAMVVAEHAAERERAGETWPQQK
jgi:hypothetical protein